MSRTQQIHGYTTPQKQQHDYFETRDQLAHEIDLIAQTSGGSVRAYKIARHIVDKVYQNADYRTFRSNQNKDPIKTKDLQAMGAGIMRKYDVNKQAALSLQECIKKAKDYGTDDPESINWICSSIVDKPNSSKNNNKSKGGMSDTWSNVNQKDQNSYTSAPDANPNAKTLDLSSIDKSQYTTTAGCVQDVMDNHGADRKTAVDFCTTPGMNLNNKGNGNGNSNTKSASIPSSIYALGLAQKPVTYMPPLTTTKTKVAFRNAAVNNRP
jgi:hypothetical protein